MPNLPFLSRSSVEPVPGGVALSLAFVPDGGDSDKAVWDAVLEWALSSTTDRVLRKVEETLLCLRDAHPASASDVALKIKWSSTPGGVVWDGQNQALAYTPLSRDLLSDQDLAVNDLIDLLDQVPPHADLLYQLNERFDKVTMNLTNLPDLAHKWLGEPWSQRQMRQFAQRMDETRPSGPALTPLRARM